ncbi:MAG: hypothetical protein ABFD97_20380 [Syntrophobacter sp.]
MDVWQQIILKAEDLDRQLDSGKITLKEYACRINGLKVRFGAAMGALKSEEMTHGNAEYLKRLKKRSLAGNGALITHTPDEVYLEVIECEQHNKQITREECKNLSGSGKCEMSFCEQNEETRALLTNRLRGVEPVQ